MDTLTDFAIQTSGLVKRFGDFTAVDSVDLRVRRGEIYGFLGPNGSGKTTTIRMLTGNMLPSSGSGKVLGHDIVADAEGLRRRIGYMSQRFSLFEDLTVDENLRFYAGVYDVPRERFAERRRYVLEMADLVGRENEITANLSVGWKQRLALGAATIHEPDLLFLDEPTSGVDPVARRHFWDLLYDLAAGGVTLFVTTHYMDEATHCHRLGFIYNGRIVAEGTPHEIRTECMTQRILEVRAQPSDVDRVLDALEADPDVAEAYLSGATLHAVVGATGAAGPGCSPSAAEAAGDADDAAGALGSRLRAAGFSAVEVTAVEATIEDVFVNLVAREREEGR